MTSWRKIRGNHSIGLIRLTALVLSVAACCSAHAFEHFITARGDRLMDGDKPFRFISWNIPNLLLIEDHLPFEERNLTGWRLPDRFEITDALATVKQMGGLVARSYVISVRRPQDAADIPRHVLAPGVFNEEAFRTLDTVLQVANEQGVRLIIPLVDNWPWMGGRAEYATFRGKTKDDFWTDPQLIADFKQTIRHVLTRTNTLTGVRYAEDKAILCWETGNELESTPEWTRDIAAYIKSLDTNHLVLDGFHSAELRESTLAMPEMDIVSTHHYPGGNKSMAQRIREGAARAEGRKPYIVGEFGFVPTAQMAEAIQAVIETQTAGALAWSLRFRNRDGGYYWHSEPLGGNVYKSFHWPGSTIADAYDEIPFMRLMREQAFAVRGEAAPAIPVPQPPVLLPISDIAAISWRGSVGAGGYTIERAANADGPWTAIATNVDESFTQNRAQFSDETATAGQWYYRVRATNAAGVSEPSNVAGPIAVSHVTLVDELADFSKVATNTGELKIETRDSRSALEDAHRATGDVGCSIVYRVASPLTAARVFAFFPKQTGELQFSVSADGETFKPAAAKRIDFPFDAGDYGYWRRAVYEVVPESSSARFLKIDFLGNAQLSRVEIRRRTDGL